MILSPALVLIVAALYLGALFLLAFISEKRAEAGRGMLANLPLVYTLSLAVYCTSWTFYGAVGSASRNGLEFLTIYLGPTLVFAAWWLMLRKLVRISKTHRITSIADFLSSRYGKSARVSALVTLIAVIGITPYIALQLKAVATSFQAVSGVTPARAGFSGGPLADTGFWVAAAMAIFVILFGTRNLGADESHPGIVAAIAFESVVKLVALVAVGVFVTFQLYDGPAALFAAAEAAELQQLYQMPEQFEARWIAVTLLSGAAILCLPRQFQVAVVEIRDESHLRVAAWLFPLYLFVITLFVLPIAIAGQTTPGAGSDPDLFVLTTPLAAGREGLALLAFIGGLSSATSMVIVASIALSIMISNHLVTPFLLRAPGFASERRALSGAILMSRRLSIVLILVLGYAYYQAIGASGALAAIGLVSFAAVAQFLPALLLGIYWRNATKLGALSGLAVGFGLWTYTLLLPTLADAGAFPAALLTEGPGGADLLRPTALFGLVIEDRLVHALFWSLSGNTLALVIISMLTSQSPLERLQSTLFVDAFAPRPDGAGMVNRSATSEDLFHLTERVMGRGRATRIFADYPARSRIKGGDGDPLPAPTPNFIAYVERNLAGGIGAASARTMVSEIAKGEEISMEALFTLLDETRAAIRYSRELETKSEELERTAQDLRRANDQLTRLDKMKDDFLSQVSHELRTPMTSIRSFAEILVDGEGLDEERTKRFIGIIHKESERLTRLLDEILDLGRLESGRATLDRKPAQAGVILNDAVETMRGLAERNKVALSVSIPEEPVYIAAHYDRLKQVFINLLSNAVKFNDNPTPEVSAEIRRNGKSAEIRIRDNGPGVPAESRDAIFTKFSRGWDDRANSTTGAGLGLAISRQIVRLLGGELTLETAHGPGAVFVVTLPAIPDPPGREASPPSASASGA